MLKLDDLFNKTLNLEEKADHLVAVEHRGEVKVLNRKDIIRLLEVEDQWTKQHLSGAGGPSETALRMMASGLKDDALERMKSAVEAERDNRRSLASLGRTLSAIQAKGALAGIDEGKLLKSLEEFDGKIDGRRSSQVGHILNGMLDWKLESKIRSKIKEFLSKYPNLLAIPRR